MVSLVFMILFIALALGIFAFAIYKAVKTVKFPMPKTLNYPSIIKRMMYLVGGIAISTLLIFIFLVSFHGYKLPAGDWAQLIFGSLIFGLALSIFVLSFILHYYGKEIDKKSDKILYISLICSGFIFFVGLILLTNGLADHVTYPLCSGLSFKYGFVTPDSVANVNGVMQHVKPSIAWYAICILTGAVLVYFICDHRYYVEYGKHGILESTFFIAFPAGIIGARLGFVIGEWNTKGFAERVANGQWWSIIAVWEGGLTIISGALVGIVVGVLWFIWRNKQYSIWLAIDIIVPTILIAQAVGRWGNFFNCEVHGLPIEASKLWFVPKMVLNNAVYSDAYHISNNLITEGQNYLIPLTNGQVYLPLFYIESLTNLIGYAFIRFGLGVGLRKYRELGDLAFSYIIWYGLTRVIMEPLRDRAFNMGADGYWSWLWAIIFVIVGGALIAINHLVRFILRKKHNEGFTNINKPLTISMTSIICAIGLSLTIVGSVLMANNPQSVFLGFNKFNNGFILLSIGLLFMMILVASFTYLFSGKKKENA